MANDANIIKIKRSGTSGAPASLKLGELAYSYLTATGNPTSNGGDRLFIGANGVNVGTGNANDVIVIGGKYFTDLLDHERGALTASSALIVDANKKLDELLVDSLSLNGNTLSTTSGDLNVILSANGNGLVQINTSTNSFTLPATRTGTTGYVLTANTDGTTSWSASASTLILNSNGASEQTVNLLEDNVVIQGKSGSVISTAITRTGTAGDYTFALDIDADLSSYVTATTLSGYNYIDLTDLSVGANGTASGSGSFSYDSLTGIFTYTPPDLSSYITGITSSDVTTALGFTPYSDANPSNFIVLQSLGVGPDGTASGSGSLSYDNLTGNFTYTPPDLSGYAESSDTIYIGTTAVTLNQASGTVSALTGIDSVSSSAGTGDVTLNASGGHSYVFADDGTVTFNGEYTFPAAKSSTAGYVLTDVAGNGTLSWAASVSSLSFKAGTSTGDTGANATISLINDSFKIKGDSGAITTALTVTGTTNKDYSLEVSARKASTSVTGVASFSSNSFDVSAGGEVTVKTSGISNTQLANSSFYIGTTSVSLGNASGSTTSLAVDISGKATTAGTADQVANSLTFAATGGEAAGATFNGSATKTIDYSTIGAAPAAGSSSIVTVGELTSGSIGTGFTAIPNTALANSSFYIGTTTVSLGATSGSITSLAVDIGGNAVTADTADKVANALSEGSNIQTFSFDGSGTATVALATTLTGLTGVEVGDLRLSGSTIDNSASATGNVVLVANDGNGDKSFTFGGDGTLNVAGKITGVATPTDATDAANKAYVDATRTGLDVKASVRVTTSGDITLSNTQTIDGVALAVNDRVLVKNQTTAADNGIYVVKSGAWTRAEDADNTPEGEVTGGMFTFVEEGTNSADSGWVLSTNGTITLGTTDLTFVQFSGAGQIVAGSGLDKTGNTLSVNVANGIEIANDNVQLASSVAGAGLTYTSGVLDVVGTADRISVNADSIDIASTYAGQTSITTLGTIGTGTWQGSLIGGTYGGTGVNNGSNTITIGGNVSTGGAVTFSGAYGFTGTLTAATSVTFPTTGTLVNSDVTTLSSLSSIGTITTGVWNGTALTYAYGGTGQTSYAKGDLLYASGANILSKLTAGTAGQTLQLQDGVPVWADLDGGTY